MCFLIWLKQWLFLGHCLSEVFQTLRDYNLALSLQFYTMFDTLFEGHRCVIVENKKVLLFKFLSTVVGDWCVFWVSLDVSFEHKCGFGSAVMGYLTCIGLQHMGCWFLVSSEALDTQSIALGLRGGGGGEGCEPCLSPLSCPPHPLSGRLAPRVGCLKGEATQEGVAHFTGLISRNGGKTVILHSISLHLHLQCQFLLAVRCAPSYPGLSARCVSMRSTNYPGLWAKCLSMRGTNYPGLWAKCLSMRGTNYPGIWAKCMSMRGTN